MNSTHFLLQLYFNDFFQQLYCFSLVTMNCITASVLYLKTFHIRRSLFLITGRHHSLHELTCLYSLFQELPINRNQNLKISTLGYSFLGNCTVEIFWFCQGHFCLYTLVFQCLMIVLLYPSMVFKNHDTIKYHS